MPTNTKDINKDFFLQLTSVDTLASHSTYLIPFLPPFKSPLLPHMELTTCIIPSYGQQASSCTITNMEVYNMYFKQCHKNTMKLAQKLSRVSRMFSLYWYTNTPHLPILCTWRHALVLITTQQLIFTAQESCLLFKVKSSLKTAANIISQMVKTCTRFGTHHLKYTRDY